MLEEVVSVSMVKQVMNIVCCSDANYLPHLSVTLRSLIAHHNSDEIEVFLVLNNCTDSQLAIFLDSIQPLNPHIISDTKISEMPFFVDRHISVTTYQRIYLDNLLPESVEKFIYLDCDTVITGSLKDLWSIPMSEYIIAAVPEFSAVNFFKNGIPYSNGFNAGILLVNRRLWHTNNITLKLKDFIIENGAKLKAWDQDALNAILVNSWKILDIKWNLSSKFFQHRKQLYKAGFENIFTDPRIIHFSASIKPWHYRLRHPYKHLYLNNLSSTYREQFAYSDKNLKTIIRKGAASFLLWLGFKAF